MSSGCIYYITKNKTEPVDFKAENYIDRLDIIHADSVKNDNNAKTETAFLRFRLTEMGAIVSGCSGNFAFSFTVQKLNKLQQNYFSPKLEELKKKAKNLTLFDVIEHAPDLNMILNNEWNDLVTMGDFDAGSTITFDDFIRQLEPGIKYYVLKKVIIKN